MNLLEHYIEKIISEEEWQPSGKYPSLLNKKWVEIKMVVNCYGTKSETTEIMPVDEWKKVKNQGYYMA